MTRAFGDGRMERFFTYDVVELTASQLAQQPKPQRGCKQPTHQFDWIFDEAKLKDAQAEDGYSAIVTTVPTRKKNCDELFSMFDPAHLPREHRRRSSDQRTSHDGRQDSNLVLQLHPHR